MTDNPNPSRVTPTSRFNVTGVQPLDPGVLFRRAVKGANMMTPEVMEYGYISPTVVYELSRGRSIMGGDAKLYGVTVASVTPSGEYVHRHDLCKCFPDSLVAARRYVASLREQSELEALDT